MSWLRYRLQFHNVCSLRSTLAFYDVKFNLLSFFKCAIAVSVNRCIMDENVIAAIDSDKSVAFLAIKPLHRSLQ